MTTYYVGNHYEVKNSVLAKYYFAGAARIAVRKDGTLNYLLGDHLGSSSVTTNMYGTKTASALYKAFGETRYALGNLNTDYKFTGQREESALGIYFFNARWYDGSLGRFMSPDTIVPTSTQGTQAWDRYAFVNNNPVRYTDPTGHCAKDIEPEECEFMKSHQNGGGGVAGTSSEGGGEGGTSGGSLNGNGGRGGRRSGNPGGNSGARSDWSVFWQNYCGGGSNVVYNVTNCVATGAQDINLGIDVVGVIFEVGGTLAGCAAGGACVAGAIAGWVAYQPLNAADTVLGGISFGGTFVADLADDGQLGDSTATALLTAGAGAASPEAFTDFIIDAYGSGYNHGAFNGILEWIATGEFFND